MHKSDQITRAGLNRIKEYCLDTGCSYCDIKPLCDNFVSLIRSFNCSISTPNSWTDSDITEILKATRNAMERTFIKSLEFIVEHNGSCYDIDCGDCPFKPHYYAEHLPNGTEDCIETYLLNTTYARTHTERTEIAEWLLEIYKGEKE